LTQCLQVGLSGAKKKGDTVVQAGDDQRAVGRFEAEHPHGTQPKPEDDGLGIRRDIIYHGLQGASKFFRMEMKPGVKGKRFHVGWQQVLHLMNHGPTGYDFGLSLRHLYTLYSSLNEVMA